MHTTATIESIFTSSSTIPGAGQIYSRPVTTPVPCCQTLINLDELEKALADEHSFRDLLSLLSASENELFATFSYSKRRREWLGGRLAAKTAALQVLQMDNIQKMMPRLSILPTENGSPRLSSSAVAVDRLPALSISHSNRFAVAMAANTEACGIDIQKISSQTVRVAERFSEPVELQLLLEHAPRLDEKERLTLLWSAKEALKKALLHDQPVIFQGVILQSLTADQYFTLQLRFPGDRNLPAEVSAIQLEDCILASTLGQISHA